MTNLALGLWSCEDVDFIRHTNFVEMFVHVVLHVPLLLFYTVYQ